MNDLGIKFKATVNELEVLESGILLLIGNEVVFNIDSLEIKLIFSLEADENKKPHYSGQVENGVLVINMYNFKDSSLGDGINTPLEIGVVNGRSLSFIFYINSHDTNNEFGLKEFKYSFLLGNKNDG
ncbi:DUF6864 domain-containing function [Photobacterium phosphoreum]|uniref:DUF6864 domain-containing function n=1 Tax=Photobacterium phosphoreum TaxID=659 RepID=UPI00242F5CCB|nr:hypothetical protein [Photobacterium phosphoreum]